MAGRGNLAFHIVLGLCGVGALVVSLCFLFPKPQARKSAVESEIVATEATPRPASSTPQTSAPLAQVTGSSAHATPAIADPRVGQVKQAIDAGLLDSSPDRVTDAQGAQILRTMAENLAAPADVMRLARSLSADPRMVELMTPMAEEWLASGDPQKRARGVLFLAALDPAHTQTRWQTAVDAERDDTVRATLLESAPVTGDAQADAPLVATLVGVAQRDAVEAVRSAALRGLPASLSGDPVRQLAAGLERERSATVRGETLALLGSLRSNDPQVVAALERTAYDPAETPDVRRAAFAALIRADNEHPGLLSEEKLALVEKTLSELGRN